METVKTNFTELLEKFPKLVKTLADSCVTAGLCSVKDLVGMGPGFQEKERGKQVKHDYLSTTTFQKTF